MPEKLTKEPSPLAAKTLVSRKFYAFGRRSEAVEAEYIDLEKADVADIMAMCSEPGPLGLAITARSLAGSHGDNGPEVAVYVMGTADDTICKIGVSKNPAMRLGAVQSGSWKALDLRAVFWVIDGSASTIEAAALRTAKSMGLKLRGEWIDGSADMGALLVAGAVKVSGMKVADSAMMLRQREAVRTERRHWH